MRIQALSLLGLLISLLPAGRSNAGIIAYSDSLLSATPSFTTEAQQLLGIPDGDVTVFSSGRIATYGDFGTTVAYDQNDLATLMGVSLSTLAAADFVAFDYNGANSSGAFESSEWTFSDGTTTLNVDHDILDGPGAIVIANNNRLDVGTLFNSIFGTSFAVDHDFGVILFDLSSHGVDSGSASFEVTLESVSSGPGPADVPDVVVLGRLTAIPEPSTISLIGLSMIGFSAYGWRRRHGVAIASVRPT